jgi:hypothetical protein
MSINREKIHEIVEVFYQPTFKTFYVNSTDGETFIKPIGVFVSLGITTALKVIEDMGEIISGYNYNTRIVEISSKKINGQFLNTITFENPSQYTIKDSEDILGKEKAEEELCRLKAFMSPNESLEVIQTYAPKIQKLQELIDELNKSPQGWENHVIKLEDGSEDYKIFHKQVNYKKENDVEYRIGIFVSEKDY